MGVTVGDSGVSARPSAFALRRVFADAVLIGATLLLALFTIAVNRPPSPSPWPPGDVGRMRLDVARDPLDPAAARDLGLAVGRSGETAESDRIMTFAAARSRRDTPTEDWLLVRRLAQGQYEEALGAADALLRRDIDDGTRERLFALLIAAAHYDASRPALVARLAPSPWWRLAFMRELGTRADPADTRLVLTGLSATAHPITGLELAPFLNRLVDGQNYRAAGLDWRTFSRPPRDPDSVGDLTAPPPFGWSAIEGDGGSSGADGGVLRVDYDGFADPRMPRRLVVLGQGPHRLTWRETVDGDPRLAVRILCAGSKQMLASTTPQAGGGSRMRALDFAVPPGGCEGQWLTIAAIPGERRSPVSGAFSDWELTSPRSR